MMILQSVRRFDRGKITSIERTPQGFLKVPGFATRVGVFTYIDAGGEVRRELRHPDDVFDPESLETLKNAPVTLEHPPVMLDPSNVKQYMKGYTSDRVEVNRDLVETDLIIADEDAISAVEDQGIRELSSGYLADLEEEPGVYNGAQYDVRQRNIKYNHLALVKHGRAGPEARLRMDSRDAIQQEEKGSNSMDEVNTPITKPVVISGESVDLPAHLADIVSDMFDKYDEMKGQLAKHTEESMAFQDEKVKDKKDMDIAPKSVSPQPSVEQMAPDGRGGASKAGPSSKGGVSKAKGLDGDENPFEKKKDEEEMEDGEDEKEKKDFDAPGMGSAMAPVEMLKKQLAQMAQTLEGMQSNNDALQAKVDEFASSTMKNPGEGKMDSAELRTLIRNRVKLLRNAEKIVPEALSQRFDSMSDDEVRASVIQHKNPKADLSGKSSSYLQSRFDSIMESIEEGHFIRKEMGNQFHSTRMDAKEPADPAQSRKAMIERTRGLWQEPLSASKRK